MKNCIGGNCWNLCSVNTDRRNDHRETDKIKTVLVGDGSWNPIFCIDFCSFTLGVYRTLNGDSVSIVTSLILCAGGGMTGALFQISPINTFVLCVVMRVLMGWCVGLLFRVLRRVDHKKSWSYFVGALSAPAAEYHFLHGLHRSGVLQDRLHFRSVLPLSARPTR